MAQIRVRAVFPRGGFGFDGQARRRDGDEFLIDEKDFSESWMVRVDPEPTQEKPAPAPKAKAKAKAKPKAKAKASAKKEPDNSWE